MNRMPRMFSQLGRFAGNAVDSEVEAEREWTLKSHAESKKTVERVRGETWSHVVLQEQSALPATLEKNFDMYPFARDLVEHVRAAGAEPIFFVTWGRRDGLLVKGMPDYETMQERLVEGYEEIAKTLGAAMAPVGPAWRAVRGEKLDVDLWHEDGIHPSIAGSYLAACVFFAVIFGIRPEGLPYTAGLDSNMAKDLQVVAGRTVLEHPQRWKLS
ncbi:MAG: DUF4886 domain-containing protein [Planctomycetota bacterium]|jgi:hypothetical protein